MSDIDKNRTQHDAQRTVANRRSTGSTRPEQAILRHLGVELYKESHRKDNTSGQPDAEDASEASPDR